MYDTETFAFFSDAGRLAEQAGRGLSCPAIGAAQYSTTGPSACTRQQTSPLLQGAPVEHEPGGWAAATEAVGAAPLSDVDSVGTTAVGDSVFFPSPPQLATKATATRKLAQRAWVFVTARDETTRCRGMHARRRALCK